MATPPTVAALATSSAIASGILWPSVQSSGALPLGDHFKYHQAATPIVSGASFPASSYIVLSSLTTTNMISPPNTVSFYFTGTTLEILTKGNLGSLLLKVDDQYTSLTPVSVGATGLQYWLPVTFASRATRRVDVLMQGLTFGGIQTGPNDTITPAETRGPRCIVVGDSFSDGSGGPTAGAQSCWVKIFAERLGWDDVWMSADGGTGYLATASGARPKFGDRLQHDCIGYSPDMVIMQGGINDYASFSAAQIQAEALKDFQAIKAALPNCLLVVLSPFWRNGPSTFPSVTLLAGRDAIKAAASTAGAVYLDLLEMPLPADLVPVATTLASTSAASASTVSVNAVVPARSVIQIENDRAEVKSVSGGGPYTLTLDGVLTSGHTAGVAVTQVGPCLWTGTGHQGSTTGYGNSDLCVYSDGTHPTQEGAEMVGTAVADLLRDALAKRGSTS